MTTRTKSITARFASPFTLRGVDRPLPAGEYRIETDEELIDGLSFIAHRSVATYIHLPSLGEAARPSQIVAIDPADLEAAIARDNRS